MNQPEPFYIRNCSLSAIATGERARSLLELREKLTTIDDGCLYYHFWGQRLNPYFVHPQHHNDFAYWVYHRLHDHVLAEQLNIIDPTEFDTLEQLRQELVERIDHRLEDYEIIAGTKREDHFHFITPLIIVFESSHIVSKPEDLLKVIPALPPSSIFYHFIDARARTEDKRDDFTIWLRTFNGKYGPLIESIQAIDLYFLSLTQLKQELTYAIQNFFGEA
ncbi:MAG: DUF5752 family protein [Parachlamydia sp.]|nr:DUF5752 family protein [Parachlamydia sp.]